MNTPQSELELSVVIPCLNEADTLGLCLEKCRRTIDERTLSAEIVVADNGSADGSQQLERGVSLSGENKAYFAKARVDWLKTRLAARGASTRTILDYGCGTGSAVPFLCDAFEPDGVLGIDVSIESLRVARERHGSPTVRFMRPADYSPREQIDLVFTNGTFHHIPPRERAKAVQYLQRAIVRGGHLALWENNPWNPGTRLVMRRIPFDRDAVMLSAGGAGRLLRRHGFEVCARDFLFVFPRALRRLRPLERVLAGLPLGAQCLVLARKPG